ncbi:MAG: phosphate ABC transporter substrate-binding protein [Oscillospiraceae bacterium]|nr:phosphate ABC transporter substrate-binding protein [Oscillospiraceae bacterium]
MKKKAIGLLALLLAALVLLTACDSGGTASGDGLSGRISLNGSTSTERVIASLIEAFREEHPGVTPTFDATGSGAGITSAMEGTADIGLSSRHLRDGEDGVDAIIFAIDGLAVIVHPDNPVTDLSTDQIAAIYTGAITNWSEVGGDDAPIAVIGREAGSGSRGAFDDIMGIEDQVVHDQELTSGGAVITAVATNSFAIGYSSLSAVGDTVRIVTVNGIPCTEETLLDGSYPIQRPFILMTQLGTEPSEATQAFIDFIMSPAATEIISNAGVVQVL